MHTQLAFALSREEGGQRLEAALRDIGTGDLMILDEYGCVPIGLGARGCSFR